MATCCGTATSEKLDDEVAAYRRGWLAQMGHRVSATVEFQTFVLPVWGFWRAAGLMLIGKALFKRGILSAKASATFYLGLIVLALVVGLPLVAYGVTWNFKNGWGAVSMFYGSQFNYWGSLAVSLGWIGAVLLICQRGGLIGLTTRLAAVGQMALTSYCSTSRSPIWFARISTNRALRRALSYGESPSCALSSAA
jgi:uncharacterized protein